jgi:hypothetical protein
MGTPFLAARRAHTFFSLPSRSPQPAPKPQEVTIEIARHHDYDDDVN